MSSVAMAEGALAPDAGCGSAGGDGVPPAAHPVARALAKVRSALADVAEAPLWSLSTDDLGRLVREAGQAVAASQHLQLRLVAAAHAAGAAERVAATSTGAWLAQVTHTTRPQAAADARLARLLDDVRYQPVQDALAAGRINLEQARAITIAVDRLPSDLGSQLVAQAQQWLVDQAATFDPRDLTRLGRHLVEVVDPERGEQELARQLAAQERSADESCWLTLGDHEGITRGRFAIPTAIAGAQLRSLLEGLAAPRRMQPGDGIAGHGEAGPDRTAEQDGTVADDAAPPDGTDRPVHEDRTDQADARDGWSYPRRLGEAFCELIGAAAGAKPPLHGGTQAHLVVTVADWHLASRRGAATTSTGEEISPSHAAQLACTGAVTSLLLGRDGLPLRLGRATRLFSPGQRLALAVRDGGCAFPGCDRPPGWCEAHHIVPWYLGGATDLDNGVLLCAYHHRIVHVGHWRVMLDARRRPVVVPPRWVDPEQRPQRNAYHRRQ